MPGPDEHAQPNPEDQSQPNAAAATPEHRPLNVTSIEEDNDPDLIEHREATAAVEAEAAAKPTEKNQASRAAPAPIPAEPTPTEPKPPGKPEVQMIPKPRFDEVNTRAGKAEQEAAYWRGVAEARAGTGATSANGQPPSATPQQTPEQKLASIHADIDALAEKFDAGEITMADFKKQERALTDKEHAIREEGTLAKVKPAAPAPEQDLYLQRASAEFVASHPWVDVFDALDDTGKGADWGYIEALAREHLSDQGLTGKAATLWLREEMAKLCDQYGPVLVKAKAEAKGIAVPGAATPAPAQQQQQPPVKPKELSPNAKALNAKLDLAERMPPNVPRMAGAGANDAGIPTEAELRTMSDEDVEALPDTIKKKIRLGELHA